MMWQDYEDINDYYDTEPWYFYPDHMNSENCWCEPELEYQDDNGNQVWVHREVQ